jgi:glutamyl-tRNA reductase
MLCCASPSNSTHAAAMDNDGMKIFVAGLSHKTAPVAVREKLAVHPAMPANQVCRPALHPALRDANLEEAVLLSTCNRVEVYGTTPWVNGNIHGIFEHFGAGGSDFAPYLYVKEGDEAVRHLLAVTSGLDSMVVGETEITGQVKAAYEKAREARLTGRVMNRLFQTALQVGKEIRTHTNIGRGAVSVGSVAVELAGKIFDRDLAKKTVMIIGAGKMGEACVRHLAGKGARSVLVSNRSFERAEGLAAEFGGRAIRFDDCLEAMVEADVVVSSTGCPQTILHRQDVAQTLPARRGRPLVMIDIAVPRDIDADVEHLENVYLYNIDHLEAIVRENVALRERELSKCREIIARRATELMARLNPSRQARPPEDTARPGFDIFQSAVCPS